MYLDSSSAMPWLIKVVTADTRPLPSDDHAQWMILTAMLRLLAILKQMAKQEVDKGRY
jgi:hypothetical protein